jgi:hypothetical protein
MPDSRQALAIFHPFGALACLARQPDFGIAVLCIGGQGVAAPLFLSTAVRIANDHWSRER